MRALLKKYGGMTAAAIIALVIAFVALRPQPLVVEIGPVERVTVSEYIAEEARTRLAREFVIDMPDAGLLERIELNVGDMVEAGQVIAKMDTFAIEQQLAAIEARIAQAEAYRDGVDSQKPKDEDLGMAAVRVGESDDAIKIAQREVEIARIEADNAAKEYQRVAELVQGGVASARDLEQADRLRLSTAERQRAAELALDSARKGLEIARLSESRVTGSVDDNEYLREANAAEADSLRAEAGIIRDRLERAVMRAPVSGPVLDKFVDDSATLPPGAPLLRIGDMASAEIECDVLSEEAGRIDAGAAVQLLGKAITGENAAGAVKQVYPAGFTKISSLGIEQQRVRVLIDYDHEAMPLRPGTRLDVRIVTGESADAIAVPERATFRRGGESFVFKEVGGRAVLTPVRVGLKNDTWAEVIEGLSEGDRVVYEPANDLEDGSLIAAWQ